jgi:hypothetical protein
MGTQRKWNVEAKVIPVIIRAEGTFSKSFRHYLTKILGKPEIKELHSYNKTNEKH